MVKLIKNKKAEFGWGAAIILGFFIVMAIIVYTNPQYGSNAWDFLMMLFQWLVWVVAAVLIIIGIILIIVIFGG